MLPVSERALVTADPNRPLASGAGNEVCLRGCSFGLLFVSGPEACELIEARFFGFGRLAENEEGGELAIVTDLDRILRQE